jgi:hypothetical protein
MKTKYTPGPWKHSTHLHRHWVSAGKGKKAVTIADVSDIDTPDGEDTDEAATIANAKLIAAAPELLEALSLLLGCAEPTDDRLSRTNVAIYAGQSAIAKALGESTK